MIRTVTSLVFIFVLATFASAQKSETKRNPAEEQIRAVLQVTAEGWNTGEQTMKNGFWKTGRPIQQLRYENIVVRMLGKENALVTGQYILSGAERPDRKGWFTTVWTKTKDGWRMIHDHS